MRLAPITTLIALSFYFHVVFCLEAPGDPEMNKALANANCNTEEIAEFNLCLQKASVAMTADEDACEGLGKSWQCFPKCLCDHTPSMQPLNESLKSAYNCTETPRCGAPARALAPGSPASSLRPSAVPVCIAAAVLVATTGRS